MKSNNSGSTCNEYVPKASVKHEKLARDRQGELDNRKVKLTAEYYAIKKENKERKAEIKKLPKEERVAATAELKISIRKRKELYKEKKCKFREDVRAEKMRASGKKPELYEGSDSGKKSRKGYKEGLNLEESTSEGGFSEE